METKTTYEVQEQYMGRWSAFSDRFDTIGEAERELDRAQKNWPNHVYALVRCVETKEFVV